MKNSSNRLIRQSKIQAKRRRGKGDLRRSFDFEKLFRAVPETAVLVRIPRIRFICFYLTAE